MNGLMSIKCHFCTTHKNKLLCSKWSRRVHATERPQTAEKNTNMSRKTRNCAERRRSRRRMFIFKRLSLKVLSALQDHEWGAGRRGNKNNYTNVSLNHTFFHEVLSHTKNRNTDFYRVLGFCGSNLSASVKLFTP